MKIRLLLFALILSNIAVCQAWEWAWGAGFGSGSEEEQPRLVIDSDDNVIVAATYKGALNLGSETYPAPPDQGRDIIVVKYNSDGDLLWSGSISGEGGATLLNAGDLVYDITADLDGNIYLSGHLGSNANAFGSNVGNGNESLAFVAQITPDGNLGWINLAGDDYLNDKMTLVEVGKDGYIYAGGYTGQDFEIIGYVFGGVMATSNSSSHLQVLIQMDTDGNVQWAKQITAREVRRMASDENGMLVVSSYSNSGGPGNAGHYLTKINANTQEEIWVRYTYSNTIGTGRSELGLHMKEDGNIVQFLTSGTSSSLDFGNGFTTDGIETNQMGVLLHIDSDGNTTDLIALNDMFINGYLSFSTESFKAIDDNTFYVLAQQNNGLEIAAGGTIDPSGGIIPSIGGRDVMVLKIDGSGNILEFASQTGQGLQYPTDIDVFSNGDAGVCGRFETASHPFFGTGYAVFGPDELDSAGEEDIFAARVHTGTEGPLGIEERANEFSFELFPVPARDKLTLRFINNESSPIFIDVFNAAGRVVKSDRIQAMGLIVEQLDLTEFRAGLYIVKLRIGDRTFGKRFAVAN